MSFWQFWINKAQAVIDNLSNKVSANSREIETLKTDVGDLGNNVNTNNSELTTVKENVTHLQQSKQDTLIAGNGINISDNRISSDVVGITPQQAEDINTNKANIDALPNVYAKLNNYSQSIKSFKYYIGKDTNYLEASGDSISLGNNGGGFSSIKSGNNYIYVNNNNAYKRVGSGDEVLASEQWVQNKINSKLTRQVISKTCNVEEDTIISSNLGDYISIITLRKRNDGKWFIWNTEATHQVYIEGTQLRVWGATSNNFTNEYQFIITLLN